MKMNEKISDTLQVLLLKYRRPVTDVVMIALIALNIWFFLIPWGQKLYELNLENSRLKTMLLGAKHDQEQKARMNETHVRSRTLLALDEFMIGQGDISKYLESFTTLAKESGVRLMSMEPVNRGELRKDDPKEENSPYQFSDIKLVAGAGYHQLGDFVAKIENQPVFMYINRIEIKNVESSPYEHSISLNIRMLHSAKKTSGDAT